MKKTTTFMTLFIAMFAAIPTVSGGDPQGEGSERGGERWIKFVKTAVFAGEGNTVEIAPSFSSYPIPDPVDDGVVRILAIGNSFSQDAVEQYLWNLADAAGYEVVIGHMYIGGCSLATHLNHAGNDAGAYAYRKIVDGVRSERGGVKLSTAIVEEPWDYISLQQASNFSGVYSTFEASLPALVEYVERWATNKDMQLMLHQTWAYPKDSGHAAFSTYGKDQTIMYNSIVDAYARAAGLVDIDIVIPSGTAIQNGRTSYLGDSFNRDGYHLKESYGRYTAACTWFEKIFGESVVGNGYVPASVLPAEAGIAQLAAHTAVLVPNEITEMVDRRNPPADEVNDGILAYPIYIDFGKGSDFRITASPWDNITSVGDGKITVSVTSGPANNDTNGFFYLNAMSIAPAPAQ